MTNDSLQGRYEHNRDFREAGGGARREAACKVGGEEGASKVRKWGLKMGL